MSLLVVAVLAGKLAWAVPVCHWQDGHTTKTWALTMLGSSSSTHNQFCSGGAWASYDYKQICLQIWFVLSSGNLIRNLTSGSFWLSSVTTLLHLLSKSWKNKTNSNCLQVTLYWLQTVSTFSKNHFMVDFSDQYQPYSDD